MHIEILSEEPDLVKELAQEFGSPEYGSIARNEVGIELEWQTLTGPKVFDTADVIRLVVTNVMSVGTSLLSRWLYDRLQSRAAKLKIDGKPVEVSPARIESVVADSIRSNKSDESS